MPYYSVLAQITLSLGSPIIQKILKIKISKVITKYQNKLNKLCQLYLPVYRRKLNLVIRLDLFVCRHLTLALRVGSVGRDFFNFGEGQSCSQNLTAFSYTLGCGKNNTHPQLPLE